MWRSSSWEFFFSPSVVLETLFNGKTNGRDGRILQTNEFRHLTKGLVKFCKKKFMTLFSFIFLTIQIFGNCQQLSGSKTTFSQSLLDWVMFTLKHIILFTAATSLEFFPTAGCKWDANASLLGAFRKRTFTQHKPPFCFSGFSLNLK